MTGDRQCKAAALSGKDVCFFHDPASREKRKQAQASGGKRRTRTSAPAAKKAQPAPGSPAVDDLGELNVIEGAKLDEDKLEALLATAIARGIEGRLSAPVLANVTKLIGVYEKFLDRKRDRGEAELARKMTTEELRAALMAHLPTAVMIAEVKRRRNGARNRVESVQPGGEEVPRPDSGTAADSVPVQPTPTECARQPGTQPQRETAKDGPTDGGDPQPQPDNAPAARSSVRRVRSWRL
jgi:hypothetical protein